MVRGVWSRNAQLRSRNVQQSQNCIKDTVISITITATLTQTWYVKWATKLYFCGILITSSLFFRKGNALNNFNRWVVELISSYTFGWIFLCRLSKGRKKRTHWHKTLKSKYLLITSKKLDSEQLVLDNEARIVVGNTGTKKCNGPYTGKF